MQAPGPTVHIGVKQMLTGIVALPCVVVGAVVVAPFSGVDLDNLTDTPMLVSSDVFTATGEELAQHGQGMKLEERDGETVAVTEKGFALQFEVDLARGGYGVFVVAMGTNGGNDSFWLELDGEGVGGAFTIPVNSLREGSMPIRIAEPGRHQVRLVLREGAGSVLKQVRLGTFEVKMPRPPMREELAGKHPRLFFTAEDLDGLRARLNDDRVQQFYKPPTGLTRTPPPFQPGKRNAGAFRGLGSYAMGHLLQPNDELLAQIIEWLEVATTYPHCGVDLDAEYFMEGVALAYDWLHDELPEDLRARVRDTIARQCAIVFEHSLGGRTGGGLSFQQNHFWFAHLSMALGAAAICGEVPEAEQWLAWAWDRFERIAVSFGPDGGFHEGPAYWDYSMPTLYLYLDLYEWCTGLRVPDADRGLAGQAEFRLHHVFPGLALSAPLEDSTVPQTRPPTKLLLWEAKRFQNPVAQGIAHLITRGVNNDRFNLLWLDEKLVAEDPREAVPLAKRYEDIETVFARTSWDDDATYAAFVCRPMGGHMYAELCAKYGISGTGHNHPEQNHFILFGRGEVLADDPGYTYEKLTRNHNTILVDGKGQYGDGQMWPRPNPGRAFIKHFATSGDIAIAIGDATSAYPPELGLERFERTFVLAGRDLAVVYDRLAAKEPRTFSWLLHHRGEVGESGRMWTIVRKEAQLTVAPLLPDAIEAETSTYRPSYVHPTRDHTPKDEPDLNLLELKTGPAAEATFLVPLLIGDAGSAAPKVEHTRTDTCDAVRVGNVVVAFNRGHGEMAVELPWGEETFSGVEAVVARLRDGERQVLTCPNPD